MPDRLGDAQFGAGGRQRHVRAGAARALSDCFSQACSLEGCGGRRDGIVESGGAGDMVEDIVCAGVQRRDAFLSSATGRLAVCWGAANFRMLRNPFSRYMYYAPRRRAACSIGCCPSPPSHSSRRFFRRLTCARHGRGARRDDGWHPDLGYSCCASFADAGMWALRSSTRAVGLAWLRRRPARTRPGGLVARVCGRFANILPMWVLAVRG